MPLTTNQSFNDLYPIIKDRFEIEMNKGEKIINAILGTADSKSIDYRIEGMGGYGIIPEYDGTTITELDQKRGFTTIIEPRERAAKVSRTIKYQNVDLSGEAENIGQRLGKSLAGTIYVDFLTFFKRAYDPNYVGADNLPWAASNHPVTNNPDVADTYSNLTNVELSINGLKAMTNLSTNMVTPDGLPTMLEHKLVLVAPQLKDKAAELFGYNRQLTPDKIPESAENGANPFYDFMYYVVGQGQFGLTGKQWAVADPDWLKMTTKLVYINRPMVKPQQENPLVTSFYAYADYQMGFAEPRAIIFSNPT